MPLAYVYDRFGGPEVEHFADLPRPAPGPGDLLVTVRAAGVNPVDWKRRSGRRPAGAPAVVLPAVMGGEVAGRVVALGPGATGFTVGDAVLGGPTTGGYAQYTLLPARAAVRKPPEVSWSDAAVLADVAHAHSLLEGGSVDKDADARAARSLSPCIRGRVPARAAPRP
ncbi:L-threonine 3-dehydrogenase [Streptomyces tendae]